MKNYFFVTSEQVELYKKLCIAVDKDLSSILKSSTVDLSQYPFPSVLADMIFDAITKDKEEPAKSILEHIQSKESSQKRFHSGGIYHHLATKLVKACNEDKQNAKKVIKFVQEHDIFKHLVKDIPDKKIQAGLLLVTDSDKIVDILKRNCVHKDPKHIFDDKCFMKMITIACIVSWLPTFSGMLTAPNNPTAAQIDSFSTIVTVSFALCGLVVTFAICAGIVSSISNAISNGERNKIIKELQKQSQNQQNSQPQNADGSTIEGPGAREEQEADEKNNPSPGSTMQTIVSNDNDADFLGISM